MLRLLKPSPPPVLLVLAAACWGFGTVLSKQAVGEIPPLSLLAIQLATSLVFLVLAGRLRGHRLRIQRRERGIAALGVLNPGLSYALGIVGLTAISASLAVLIWAGEPILILVLAASLLRERVTGWLVALSGLAFAGLAMVLFDPAASGQLAGIVISATGVLCCAIYTVAVRRWISASDSTVAVVIAQELWALGLALGLVLGLASLGTAPFPGTVSVLAAATALASGLLYYGLAYWLYLEALRRLPAAIAATSFYLIPIFGIAGAMTLGERLKPIQWSGAVIVVAAVASIGLFRRRERRAGPMRPDGAIAV